MFLVSSDDLGTVGSPLHASRWCDSSGSRKLVQHRGWCQKEVDCQACSSPVFLAAADCTICCSNPSPLPRAIPSMQSCACPCRPLCCPSVRPSVLLSACLSVCPSVCPSARQSVSEPPSLSVYLSACLCAYLSAFLCMSVTASVRLSAVRPSFFVNVLLHILSISILPFGGIQLSIVYPKELTRFSSNHVFFFGRMYMCGTMHRVVWGSTSPQ